MSTPTERIRRELRSKVLPLTVGDGVLSLTARSFKDVTDTSKLRQMLEYARKQFLKTWSPKDVDFWKRRIKELEEDLKKRGVR